MKKSDQQPKFEIELWHDKHSICHSINWLPNVGDIIYLKDNCKFSVESKTFSFRVVERIFWDDKWEVNKIDVAIKVKRAYPRFNSVPLNVKPMKQPTTERK